MYSVISEDEPIVGVLTTHLNKVVRQLNERHIKPWELKPQQKDLMQVFESTG